MPVEEPWPPAQPTLRGEGKADGSKVRRALPGKMLMVFLAGLAGCLLSLPFDASVWAGLKAGQTPEGLVMASYWSKYTQWQWLMLPCAVGVIISWRFRRREWLALMVCVMISASLAGLSAAAMRGLTGRVRPKAADVGVGWYGPWRNHEWVMAKWNYNSFPSGHVTVASALVATLFVRRRRLGLLLTPLPLTVGYARMYLGAHHLSDVLAGAAIGTMLALYFSDRLWSKLHAMDQGDRTAGPI